MTTLGVQFQCQPPMLSPSHTRTLASHVFDNDGYLPKAGEIIVVRPSQDLTGPGSDLSTLRNLPSKATSHNYRNAVVSSAHYNETVLEFDVFPIPSYSTVDESGLTSTNWLLSQPLNMQLVCLRYRTSSRPHHTHRLASQPLPHLASPYMLEDGRTDDPAGCQPYHKWLV